MTRFTNRYAASILGVLSGFDRLVFRGTLRSLAFAEGMAMHLSTRGVLLKDFGPHVHRVSQQLKEASYAPYRSLGLPIEYLTSARESKEEKARRYAAERGITAGPICLLKVVEPCQTFDVHTNQQTKQLELVHRLRKCLHLYHYQVHPTLGFMNARIQTWFPFSVQICLNGREWLARQMDGEGIAYERHDNTFAGVADFQRAQALLDLQRTADWPQLLGDIAEAINPLLPSLGTRKAPATYYWTTYQSEWATDITFSAPQELARLYPMLVRHAMSTLDSPSVLRFLGRHVPPTGILPSRFGGEVTSDLRRRSEGVRIKHTVNGNSVKAYDKLRTQDLAVLRVEATVNNAADFRVYRPKEGGREDDLQWRPLRRGIADLHRRAQLSQRANERYLDALASVDDGATLGELLRKITAPTEANGRRVRALNPFAAHDQRLCAAVSRGEFAISGLRNRDLQALLFAEPAQTPEERRKRSAWVSYRLRILRAHGILAKVPKTHRYQVTAEGRRVLTAILTAREASTRQLLPESLRHAA